MFNPQRFGRYLLVKRLSTGGMAEVFLARAPARAGAEQFVAIKRILPWANEETEFTNMFIDEACISAGLKHPNIAKVLEFGQERGHYFLAMEYLSGRDLRSVLTYLQRTKTRPPVPMVLVIGMRLAQALDYAHRQKRPDGESMEIIHRDVSPPNVLISYDGGVKLIDFGIARASSRATRTRAGRLKGKIAYMSPEQVQGKDIDQRADLFSLGVILYELITATSLFHGKNQLDTMHQVRRAEVPLPSSINPEVPEEVDQILLTALARERTERYQTAGKLREALQRHLVRSRAVFGPEHLLKWMQKHFAGAYQEEQRTLRGARGLSLEDYPEEEGDFGETPAEGAPASLLIYEADNAVQVDLKATLLDGPPPGMTAPAPAPLSTLPRARLPIPMAAPLPRPRKVPSPSPAPAPPPARPPADPDMTPRDGAAALDNAVTPREGMTPGHRQDDTPVQLPAGAPISKPSVLRSTLAPNFDDAWTPAEGINAPPVTLGEVDDEPTDLAIPSFPDDADMVDTLDHNRALPPSAPGLHEDATLVDHQLFSGHPSHIAPGDHRDRAVAGGAIQVPMPDGPRGPRVEPIAPGPNRDRAAAGGELQVTTPHGPRGPRVEPIAPGSNRDRMAVGGSVSVASSPDINVRDLEDVSRVSVEGIDDGQTTGYFRRHEPLPAPPPAATNNRESTWAQAVTEKRLRLSNTKIIAIAASLTLVVVGVIAVLTLIPAGKGKAPKGAAKGGTVVVTTTPPAACTISLDEKAKGLLSPGTSLSLTGISGGPHSIAVNCVGYKPYSTEVEVNKAEATLVQARLIK